MRIVGAAKPERMSSMEREPKTLSLGELNYARVSKAPSLPAARQIFAHTYHEKLEITLLFVYMSIIVHFLQEAALYVLTTHSSQDAARIFTEATCILLCCW
jgi:hypothetical protein